MYHNIFVLRTRFIRGLSQSSTLHAYQSGIAECRSRGGVSTFQGGMPVTPTISTDRAGVGNTGQRPDTTSSIAYKHGNVNDYFSTSSFALPALGTFGNTGLNTVRLPGLNSTQFSVAKKATFHVASEHAVTTAFQAQFFNLFNHSSFNGVGTTYGAVTFGKITPALEPRNIAFRLKFSF
jgi:hypothetical protein